MFTQLKATIAGAFLLVVLIIIGLIYWRGSSNANTKNDLRVAREVVKIERETKKVETVIDMRVNAEAIQTTNTAQEATREIERIREVVRDDRARVLDGHGTVDGTTGAAALDEHAARVLQLAREARAAAIASGAKLQPARACAR